MCPATLCRSLQPSPSTHMTCCTNGLPHTLSRCAATTSRDCSLRKLRTKNRGLRQLCLTRSWCLRFHHGPPLTVERRTGHERRFREWAIIDPSGKQGLFGGGPMEVTSWVEALTWTDTSAALATHFPLNQVIVIKKKVYIYICHLSKAFLTHFRFGVNISSWWWSSIRLFHFTK